MIAVIVVWLLGYGLSGVAALAIDPTTPFWGLALPLLLVGMALLFVISLWRDTSGWVRWLVIVVHVAVPLYVGVMAVHFHIYWPP